MAAPVNCSCCALNCKTLIAAALLLCIFHPFCFRIWGTKDISYCLFKRASHKIFIRDIMDKRPAGNYNVSSDVPKLLEKTLLSAVYECVKLKSRLRVLLTLQRVPDRRSQKLQNAATISHSAPQHTQQKLERRIRRRSRPVARTATYRVWQYQVLYNTIWSPADGHNSVRNM